jgi:hypothetical protein
MKPRRTLRALRRRGPLIAVSAAAALLVAIAVPASAQFFPFGGPMRPPRAIQQAPQQSPFGNGGFPFFSPYEQQRPPPQVDYSHAPKPEKTDSVPERYVLVLGDSMADWLAYGLEEAFTEQPDMGVIRKHKTVSGLIKYQPKGEPSDWIAAAKTIVPAENADVIVVMLGLNDRTSIREPAPDKADAKGDKADKKKTDAKPAAKPDADAKPSTDAAKTPDGKDGKIVDTEQSPDDQADNAELPPIIAPEKSARTPNGLYEFRDDRWVELYNKKIDDMIAVLKTKGVPVIWVGLPAVRGPKATSDMLFLDALYREAAAKAGITYVDVWDGFVDEGGRFMQQGPDFEGQIRKLRTPDGVYFTKPGARKLAHYVDREIERLLANRNVPIALPNEPATPDLNARPGAPAPRPLAGPIVPLVASSVESDALLGGPGTRPAQVDPLAARIMVKGEPLQQLAGRADDYMWPRREIGHIDLPKDVPVANGAPGQVFDPTQPQAAPKKKRPAIVNQSPGSWPFLFRRPNQPQTQAPLRPQPLRPPGYVNRAASVPPAAIAR